MYTLSLPDPLVTLVIPTLKAGAVLEDCVSSLAGQSLRDFQVIVVDNSGLGLAGQADFQGFPVTILENRRNLGFGAAINQGWRGSSSPFLATINDDARAHPGWLDAMVSTLAARNDAGFCACRVLLDSGRISSAGLLLGADGSSRQRGYGEPIASFSQADDVLIPSGCAALFRRRMIEETGGFDEDFFLYCEDTDLGLRAHWAGWRGVYAPDAEVDHIGSHTAGGASPLKAYLAERNRIALALKTFPADMLVRAFFAQFVRYFWHTALLLRGSGKSAEFRGEGHGVAWLAWFVLRAHAAAVRALPRLWRQRRAIRASARIPASRFRELARRHAISLRKV
ncbi:MAG: glycosyltransferase family 2 protein, partial [Bryobacteraceae bacterium]